MPAFFGAWQRGGILPLRNHKFLSAAIALAAIAVCTLASQEGGPATAESDTVSFVGERLVYRVKWDPPWFFFFLPKMEAGEVEIELTDGAEYKGKKALKVHFKARSSGTLVKLAGVKIEDDFVFHTEPETLCTMSASERVQEGKRKRQIDVQYLRETRQLHIREVDEAPVPPVVKKDEFKNDIPECVHDPLSAIYIFRKSPLQEKYTRSLVLANDDKIKDIRATVEKKEILQTSSGNVAAWKTGVASLMGGLFKEGGQFKIWFSADEKKVPVQFEVKVKLGRVFGELKR